MASSAPSSSVGAPARASTKRGASSMQSSSAAASASASAASAVSASPRPAKRAHIAAQRHTIAAAENADESTWSSMYASMPARMQTARDHTSEATPAAADARASVRAAGGGYVPALLCSLLPSAAAFDANFDSKVKDKHLMLDNSRGVASAGANLGDAAARQARHRRRKRGVQMLSSNQRKALGMAHIPKDNVKYEMFVPLHELWVQYMQDLLDPAHSRGLSVGERVLKADYHGALLTVVRCRSPTHVGQRGLVVQETQETFVIVTAHNAIKVLPKRQSVFSFSVPLSAPAGAAASTAAAAAPAGSVFELYGDHLCFRSYERSSRKFKAKATIQL